MKLVMFLLFSLPICCMEQEKKTHHSMTHSTHDIRGTISDEEKAYKIDMHVEEKDSRESDNESAKYTSRFLIVTNASTAIITAGLSAGVAIAVAYNTCGK